MKITYLLNGEQNELETSCEDDLREMAQDVEARLRQQHPELQDDPNLPIRVADGLLNSLCLDAEQVELPELRPATS